MRTVATWLASLSVLAASATTAARADVDVVVSIKPIHSLVAGVMKGVGTPTLIVDGAASPHSYALKPSQATALQNADVVFWMGHNLETFLEKSLEGLASKARVIELIDAKSLTKLEMREGSSFEAHAHHEGDDHDDHDHGAEEAKHAGHEGHGHDETDVHVWLDPLNAVALVGEIEAALSKADAPNAATYKKNADALVAQLKSLVTEVSKTLKPVQGKGYIVFHDAYQYFEKRFGVTATGSVTVSPEVMPSAKRIKELRAKVKRLDVACVFSEPQFEPKLMKTVAEGTSAKTAVLDLLGASIDNGPDLYFTLIRNMANSLRTCLSKAS
ncbi:MAG: zinc ABC transporter substrate-binding protein [Pseudomonadota bacterium]